MDKKPSFVSHRTKPSTKTNKNFKCHANCTHYDLLKDEMFALTLGFFSSVFFSESFDVHLPQNLSPVSNL